jgi:hypothetical protein
MHCPYSERDAVARAQALLENRISNTAKHLNWIMAVPIVNWESVLLEQSSKYGSCHYINIESRGFFASQEDWQEYRLLNLSKLEAGFESAYRENEINILFLYLSEFHIDPQQLARFRQRNVILIHFNWDDRLHYVSSHRGQSVGVRQMAKAVDFNLTMAVGSMSRYVADGAAVFYWQGMDSNDLNEISLPHIEFNRMLFFGSCYGFRETLIDYLRKKNLPIDVYGSGWGTGFISYEKLNYLIPRYALNLGISTIGYSESLYCVKGRDIEVPLAGGLYLVNHSIEIAQVYIPNQELLTYRSKEECYRKASEVLNNPTTYAPMRRNGHRKAQKFSWDSRFNYLVSLINRIVAFQN